MPTSLEPMDVETGSEPEHESWRKVDGKSPSWLTRLSRAIFRRKPKPSMREIFGTGYDPYWWDKTNSPMVREIRKNPHGWPRLSAAIDSDPNFMIYRRFGYLRTRLLTYHQDVLREMEVALDKLDKNDDDDDDANGTMCFRQGDDARQPALRKELFQSLNKELHLYDKLLIRSQRLYAFGTPTKRNQQNVINMIWNDASLAVEDREYIRHVDDLITFEADIESSWVHKLVGSLFDLTGERFTRHLFRNEIQLKKMVDNPLGIQSLHRAKFNKGVEYVFVTFAIITLIGPIYVLNAMRQTNEYIQNTAVFISTALFAFLLSSTTLAKRHEVFAVTSAYCAVLVVFTSQNTNASTL